MNVPSEPVDMNLIATIRYADQNNTAARFSAEDVEIQVRWNSFDRRYELDAQTEDGFLPPMLADTIERAASIVQQIIDTGEVA